MEVRQPHTAARASEPAPGSAPRAAWPLAIALSIALGVVFRLTAWHRMGVTFLPGYVWGPATGVAILLYLWLARGHLRAAGTSEGETASPEPTQIAWAVLVIAAFVTNAFTFAPCSHYTRKGGGKSSGGARPFDLTLLQVLAIIREWVDGMDCRFGWER